MGVVCVVGSANLDVMVRVERLPEPGETVLGEAIGSFPGGKGLNQAMAAMRCGASTIFCGQVGSDSAGMVLRSAMVDSGMDDQFLRVSSDFPTGIAQVSVLPGSGNSIIVTQGANAVLLPADAAAATVGAEVVLVQLEIPTMSAEAALIAGRQAGAVTILNAAPAAGVTEELLRQVEILVVNESEAAALGGAAGLLEAGPQSVIVTLGAKGALWLDRSGGVLTVPAFPVGAVDTTGSGDAFCGALAAALSRGMAMPAALREASAAGAIVATAVGAQTDRLNRDSVYRLADVH